MYVTYVFVGIEGEGQLALIAWGDDTLDIAVGNGASARGLYVGNHQRFLADISHAVNHAYLLTHYNGVVVAHRVKDVNGSSAYFLAA